MKAARALEINAMLVNAWFVSNGIRPGVLPDLERITVAEALEATERVLGMPAEPLPGGVHRYVAHVSLDVVPALHAFVVAANAVVRIVQEWRASQARVR